MNRGASPLFWQFHLTSLVLLLSASVLVAVGFAATAHDAWVTPARVIWLAGSLAALLGISWLAALYFRGSVLKPLRRLIDSLQSVTNGKLSGVVPQQFSKRTDEIGILADGIQRATGAFDVSLKEKTDLLEEMLQHQYELNNTLIQNALRLEASTEELIQAEKMAALGRLVAGMAHEINTPVGNAVTATSLIRERLELLEQSAESNRLRRSDLLEFFRVSGETVRSLQANLERAATLIRGFKDVAVDHSYDELRTINVVTYVEEVMLSLHPQLKKRPITWKLEASPHLECEVWPGSLAQVITNLVVNSLTHGFAENEPGALHLAVTVEQDHTTWVYSDTGRGIPPEHINKIFEPFFTTKRNTGGTGLGLHIVFNIVRQKFKGELRVESQPGQGVCFFWTIPRSLS